MIPRIQLIAWRKYAPWFSSDQVEHDLVLSRAICELYNHPVIHKELAFRGGTALHKLFFPQSGRFSEDLDFVQMQPGPIGTITNAIRECLDPWLANPNWKQGQGRYTLFYRFNTEVEPIVSRKVKIEINTREHFSLLGYQTQIYAVDNPWFTGQTQVATFKLEELLGTKLRALYQRKKGRDLFDLWFALTTTTSLDKQAVVDTFKHYLNAENKRISAVEFEKNLLEKLRNPVFSNDILPLLENEKAQNYQVEAAYQQVQQELIWRL